MFIGGAGTGTTHLASALAVSGIKSHNKHVRFFSMMDLVNLLERKKVDRKASRISKDCFEQTWIYSMSLDVYPSARVATSCYFTCFQNWCVITTKLRFLEWSCFRRRQGVHCVIKSADTSVPHRRNGQRALPHAT